MLKQKPVTYLLFFVSLILYSIIGYGVQRHETLPLFVCYFSLFVLYLLIIRDPDYKFWIAAALIFRTVLLFAVPALSDDFYRFIWDGRLLAAGEHPFAHVPSFYMTHAGVVPNPDAALFDKLNSKETFTIYPPVAQFTFWLSVKLSTGSIYSAMVLMKVIIFIFEAGTLWMFTKVAQRFNVPTRAVLLYGLNPLVILELTGNLHFEGVMVFFLLAAILLLARGKQVSSALAWSSSICSKLIPLAFLPLLPRYLGWKKATSFWVITAAFTLLLFVPLFNADIVNRMATSIGYYFQRFEFNASVYYIVRALGYWTFGFNIIQFSGPLLALTATVIILYISFRDFPLAPTGKIDAGLFRHMLWCLFTYFLCTATLHPWYIITLLAISVFTPYRFTVVWTAMIFLTYAGYSPTGFHENLLLVALEYAVVIGYLLYETVWKKKRDRS